MSTCVVHMPEWVTLHIISTHAAQVTGYMTVQTLIRVITAIATW